MPVASSTQPSSTKIGTETSTMFDMPSSMRPSTTSSGTLVVNARKLTAPSPKQKAIGTPATRHTATKPTRKIRMFSRPNVLSCGDSHVPSAASAATSTAAAARCGFDTVRTAYTSTIASIATMPNGIAATRNVFGISSVAVVMYHSSRASS